MGLHACDVATTFSLRLPFCPWLFFIIAASLSSIIAAHCFFPRSFLRPQQGNCFLRDNGSNRTAKIGLSFRLCSLSAQPVRPAAGQTSVARASVLYVVLLLVEAENERGKDTWPSGWRRCSCRPPMLSKCLYEDERLARTTLGFRPLFARRRQQSISILHREFGLPECTQLEMSSEKDNWFLHGYRVAKPIACVREPRYFGRVILDGDRDRSRRGQFISGLRVRRSAQK